MMDRNLTRIVPGGSHSTNRRGFLLVIGAAGVAALTASCNRIDSVAGTLAVRTLLMRLTFADARPDSRPKARRSPPATALPASQKDDQSDPVHQGREIFDETPRYAPSYTGARMSCGDCHIHSGTEPYAAPMIDLAEQFPAFSERAGRVISLEERIQECFARSENGRPLPSPSPEMQALVAYIKSLSRSGVKGAPYKGRGLVKLALLSGNAMKGEQAYVSQCASCHRADGAGSPPAMPPVWGPTSFNDGAGLHRTENMAEFLFHNMPQNHPGTLTAQEAFDIAAFIATMPRPKFNEAYSKY